MFFLELKRIIRSGFINFIRSGIVSLSSILVMTITLSVITAIIFLQAVLQFSLSEIKDKVDIAVYFNVGAPESQVFSLQSSLEKLPEVASVRYVSAEEALVNFKIRHADDYLTLQALEELDQNPLGASLNIKARETSQYENIAQFLEGDGSVSGRGAGIIDKINYYQNKIIIDKLDSIIDGAQRLGVLLTLLFVIISIIITFNTIRLTIYIAREEIGVMRLVGAGNRYIRGPFMVEGIIYGIISSIITMILFYPMTLWLGNTLTGFLGLNVLEYYLSNFFQIFVIILLSGAALGAISSFLAIRKYLAK